MIQSCRPALANPARGSADRWQSIGCGTTLTAGLDVALVPAWNPPTENAIDSLVVEFAGAMYDLGN